MRKIGINLHAIAGLTDEEYICEAASLGFNSIFSGVREAERQAAIGDFCVKYGMEYETLHAPFGHINDIWLEDDNGMLNELLGCVDHCVLCGAPIAVVHLSAGRYPKNETFSVHFLCDKGLFLLKKRWIRAQTGEKIL